MRAYEEALTIRRRLADDNPSVIDFQFAVAYIHFNIGNLMSGTSRPAEAMRAYDQAMPILRASCAITPNRPISRASWA